MSGYFPDIEGTTELHFWIGDPNVNDAAYSPNAIQLVNKAGVLSLTQADGVTNLPLAWVVTDTNTSSVVNILTLDHQVNGPEGVGLGSAILFNAETAGAPTINLGRVYATFQGSAPNTTLVLTTYQSSVEQVGLILSNNLVTINQAAKIAGLGTAAPSLTIAGSGNSSGSGEPALYLTTTDTGGPTTWHFYAGSGNSSQNLRIGTGGTFDMINIDTSGHVLIGNTSGTSLLSVGSSAQLTVDTSGNLTAGADLKHTGMHVGFFNVSVVTQPSAVGAAAGYTAGTTVATFHSDDVYSGNTGTTKYTINGIVAALKGLGLLAA